MRRRFAPPPQPGGAAQPPTLRDRAGRRATSAARRRARAPGAGPRRTRSRHTGAPVRAAARARPPGQQRGKTFPAQRADVDAELVLDVPDRCARARRRGRRRAGRSAAGATARAGRAASSGRRTARRAPARRSAAAATPPGRRHRAPPRQPAGEEQLREVAERVARRAWQARRAPIQAPTWRTTGASSGRSRPTTGCARAQAR